MTEEKICLGAVVGVHGIRGEVKVKSFSDDERHLTAYGLLSDETGNKTFDVKIVGHSKDLLRVKIKGVDDRNTAETLVGTGFYTNRSNLPELKDDEFYHTDLIGLDVKTSDNQLLGKVNAVYNFGAGDIIEIAFADGNTEMLPFTESFVPTVDIKQRFIIVEMAHYVDAEAEESSDDEG